MIVATDPNETVDSLITAFCIEKGIQHRKNFVLHNKDLDVLPNTRKLNTVGVQNGDILFLGYRETSDQWPCGCNQWWLIASVAMLIAAGGLVAISILYVQQGIIIYEYGIVIDAGSTHSYVYAYKWDGSKNNGTAIPEEIFSNRTVPGIANYTEDPLQAGKSLEPSLQGAEESIPKKHLKDTPVYLGATAGMRLLDASNKTASDAIMNSTRSSISKFGFKFDDPQNQVCILEGRSEAAYSWITVNYLSGIFIQVPSLSSVLFSSSRTRTIGALDLGGASTEISFEPERLPETGSPEFLSLMMYGSNYTIYAGSYLCYGLNEAYRQYLADLVENHNSSLGVEITDPCSPRGSIVSLSYQEIFEVPCTMNRSHSIHKNITYMFRGSSDVNQCTEQVKDIFTSCTNPPCPIDHQTRPPVYGEFLAFSGYFYTMNYLNLTNEGGYINLVDFEKAYKDLCMRNLSDMTPYSSSDALPGIPQCFRAVYIHTLLLDVYGFNGSNWNNLKFVNKVNGNDLGWAVGYMLNASNAIPEEYPSHQISTLMFVLLTLLFGAFIVIGVGFACHARKSRRQEMQYRRMATYGTI